MINQLLHGIHAFDGVQLIYCTALHEPLHIPWRRSVLSLGLRNALSFTLGTFLASLKHWPSWQDLAFVEPESFVSDLKTQISELTFDCLDSKTCTMEVEQEVG